MSKGSINLLKHHGTYQQDDRERRAEARGDGAAAEGQVLTASWSARRSPAGGSRASNCWPSSTCATRSATRRCGSPRGKGLQLHGVLKKDLKKTIARINEVQLTTLAACGDVKRNVMCSPCPYNGDPVHEQMYRAGGRDREAAQSADQGVSPDLAHRRRDGRERRRGRRSACRRRWRPGAAMPGDDPVEPIYGKTYLPRKFKIAIGLPGDNSVDVYANDVGLLAICENWNVVGYNVLVGGGFGVTPSAKKTFPAVAHAAVLRRGRRGRSTCASRSSRCSATSATGPTARWPA